MKKNNFTIYGLLCLSLGLILPFCLYKPKIDMKEYQQEIFSQDSINFIENKKEIAFNIVEKMLKDKKVKNYCITKCKYDKKKNVYRVDYEYTFLTEEERKIKYGYIKFEEKRFINLRFNIEYNNGLYKLGYDVIKEKDL